MTRSFFHLPPPTRAYGNQSIATGAECKMNYSSSGGIEPRMDTNKLVFIGVPSRLQIRIRNKIGRLFNDSHTIATRRIGPTHGAGRRRSRYGSVMSCFPRQ